MLLSYLLRRGRYRRKSLSLPFSMLIEPRGGTLEISFVVRPSMIVSAPGNELVFHMYL